MDVGNRRLIGVDCIARAVVNTGSPDAYESTHELAMEAALESYGLFQMLEREGLRNDEEWFPFILRATVQRLNTLNQVQMLMFDPDAAPDLAVMRDLMFGRPTDSIEEATRA